MWNKQVLPVKMAHFGILAPRSDTDFEKVDEFHDFCFGIFTAHHVFEGHFVFWGVDYFVCLTANAPEHAAAHGTTPSSPTGTGATAHHTGNSAKAETFET